MQTNSLWLLWKRTAFGYSDNERLVSDLWEELERAYTAKSRYYHNLNHLEYMADKAVEFKDCLTDWDTVIFSIFYHDIVYNIHRKDNEEKSAKAARGSLKKIVVPSDKIDKCEKQILATKDHRDAKDNDTNYLVDFDLAVLGESKEGYKDYTEKIRKEYSIYPDFMYNKGRKKVLQHFLAMERIFKTDTFYFRFEQQARENLQNELREL